MGGSRRVRLRGDDEPPRGAPRRAGRGGAVLVARARRRSTCARRHGEGALPHDRRASSGGGADALPGRAPLRLRLVPVGLPADVHVLRDRRDALRPQPECVGDPRPGSPLPPDGGGEPPRLHGHGRADAEPRARARSRATPAGRRHHAPPHDDLDRRLAAGTDAIRGRGRGADPAGASRFMRRTRSSARRSCP